MKDEGGGMKDEVKAIQALFSSSILPPSSFHRLRLQVSS
jgi:hypothetical protein